jgi:endonuclease/exonuclease/phosphatase family metal-dependent hydrolase
MSAALKLISLNIERSKHLDLVENFLHTQMPDVACLQEVMEYDLERLSNALSTTQYAYEPVAMRPQENPPGAIGLAIFSKLPMQNIRKDYYVGEPGVLRDNIQADPATYNNMNRLVFSCEIEHGDNLFRIATTHFRWTPDGAADDGQRKDIAALFRVLEPLGEFVLAGDFNAPRGGEIFALLADRYKDNVPAKYKTSIDGSLHRSGPLPHMVDGIFSTPGHTVADVEMICGVSDHCALRANIEQKDS